MFKVLLYLKPDFEAGLTDLPLNALRARGIKVLAFDLDNTLAYGRTRQFSDEAAQYLKHVGSLGFKIMLASNAMGNITQRLGGEIGATAVPATWFSRKPMKSYFRRLVAASGHCPGDIAMIGDRIFTDVLGANAAGLVTVRVRRHLDFHSNF